MRTSDRHNIDIFIVYKNIPLRENYTVHRIFAILTQVPSLGPNVVPGGRNIMLMVTFSNDSSKRRDLGPF